MPQVDQEIEILYSTVPLGIFGVDDDFQGLGVTGRFLRETGGCWIIHLTGQGFYGAYDSPVAPIRGAAVKIQIDPTLAQSVEEQGDKIVLRF